MESSPSLADSQSIAEQAFTLVKRFDIAPTPDNYTVWYSYASGENTSLTQALDILISNDEVFTTDRCKDIYQQFFMLNSEAEELTDTTRAVQREIQRILDFITEASDANKDYDENLKRFSGNLLGDLSVDEIRLLLDTIVSQTGKMQASNERLEREIKESAQEITLLRENLVTAEIESQTDGLTGLANRKLFEKNLRQAVVNAMEHGQDLTVVMADVDHFKSFNDKWGHLLGDQILKLIASLLKSNVIEGGTAARFGGEEFVVLLPETDIRTAVALADKIRQDISSKKARKKDTGESIGRITCSFGVAAFRNGEPMSEFIARADSALYEAKRTGRDRVVDESLVEGENSHATLSVA